LHRSPSILVSPDRLNLEPKNNSNEVVIQGGAEDEVLYT
jgi:hypothetical protein